MADLTSRQMDALRLMLNGEELIAEGLAVWVGLERFGAKTVKALLRCCAIRDISDKPPPYIYIINDFGRAILRRPALADEIELALLRGIPVTLLDDHLVPMEQYQNG